MRNYDIISYNFRFLLQRETRQSTTTSSSITAGQPGVSKLQLPSNVLAATDRDGEVDVGLLNLAAPRTGPLLDWDPDIVETLDDAFEGHTEVVMPSDVLPDILNSYSELLLRNSIVSYPLFLDMISYPYPFAKKNYIKKS